MGGCGLPSTLSRRNTRRCATRRAACACQHGKSHSALVPERQCQGSSAWRPRTGRYGRAAMTSPPGHAGAGAGMVRKPLQHGGKPGRAFTGPKARPTDAMTAESFSCRVVETTGSRTFRNASRRTTAIQSHSLLSTPGREMASIGMTRHEVVAATGIARSTLEKHFGEELARGRAANLATRLREAAFEAQPARYFGWNSGQARLRRRQERCRRKVSEAAASPVLAARARRNGSRRSPVHIGQEPGAPRVDRPADPAAAAAGGVGVRPRPRIPSPIKACAGNAVPLLKPGITEPPDAMLTITSPATAAVGPPC